MTGRRHPDTPATIEDRQAQVDALLSRLSPSPTPPLPATAGPLPQSDLSDNALVEKAHAAKNGLAFAALGRGDWQAGGYPSHSEADAALCARLAYWTHNDAARMDRLFRLSGLMRDKWERADYRTATIQKAMQRGDTPTPTAPRTIYPTADECAATPATTDRRDAGRVAHDGPLVEFFTPSQLRNARIPPGTNMAGDYHIQRGAPFIIAGAPCVGKSLAATALAVAAACGWPADLPDEAILERLLALNQAATG